MHIKEVLELPNTSRDEGIRIGVISDWVYHLLEASDLGELSSPSDIIVGNVNNGDRISKHRKEMVNYNNGNLAIILVFLCCSVSGTQTYGPVPTDVLPWKVNASDLIVYGKTATNDVQWVNHSIQTLNTVEIYDILKQDSPLHFTVGDSVSIYTIGGRIDDPAQVAAHNGITRQALSDEWGIGSNQAAVYFIRVDKEGRYHLLYSEAVYPDYESSLSSLSELKNRVSDISPGIPVPERRPKKT